MSNVVNVTAMGVKCYECNNDGCQRLLWLGMGNANGPLMSGSIGDAPYGRTSPNRQWVPTILSRFMTLSMEWVRSPFKALAHGGQGAAIDGWWCEDPCCKEVSFSPMDVGAGGWVARLIPLRV